MDKKRLKELAGSPQLISGIYNYCDRWCERCPFTSRCLNFAMSSEQSDDQESSDIRNEKFWYQLSETLQVTKGLLKEWAIQEGIDLDAIDTEEIKKEEQLKNEVAKSNEYCHEAMQYSNMVDEWFDSASQFFEESKDEGMLEKTFEPPNIEYIEGSPSYEDAMQVIKWYQHFIHVKLERAVRGKLDEQEDEPDEYQKDSDGSAKVALIAIDRSIAAWGEMRNHFLAREDDMFRFITQLEYLRRMVEKEFPDARSFFRPGFDKIDLND